MNHQFDQMTKSLAQSVSRRMALRNLGIGLAGVALAAFGLANKAQAGGSASVLCCRYSYGGGKGRKAMQYNMCVSDTIGCPPSIIAGEVPYTLVSARSVNDCSRCT